MEPATLLDKVLVLIAKVLLKGAVRRDFGAFAERAAEEVPQGGENGRAAERVGVGVRVGFRVRV